MEERKSEYVCHYYISQTKNIPFKKGTKQDGPLVLLLLNIILVNTIRKGNGMCNAWLRKRWHCRYFKINKLLERNKLLEQLEF